MIKKLKPGDLANYKRLSNEEAVACIIYRVYILTTNTIIKEVNL